LTVIYIDFRPDAGRALIADYISPARRDGRRRKVDVREVLQGVLDLLETGCQWRHLPKDFPPRSTIREYFDRWRHGGTPDHIHETLHVALRGAEDREALPTAAIIDSRTAKSTGKEGLGAGGFGVPSKRFIVGCTLSWIRCNRRLARDAKHLPVSRKPSSSSP